MEYEQRSALRARGCVLALATLLVGVAVGVWLTLSLLGVGLGQLFGRAQGREDVPPLLVTPAPERPAPIQGAAAPGRRLVWGAPIPLDTDTREPDLLVVSRNYDREPDSDTVAYLSPDQGTVRWESQPLGENGNSWVITYGDTMVFIADETRLLALRRDSGELAWEAPLTDSIADSICADCLQVFADVVVALPQDGMLQAFAVATGAPRWSVRLRETTRQIVRVGNLVGVPDSISESDSDGAIFLYGATDGAPAERIVPTCLQGGTYEQRMSYYGDTSVSPDGRSVAWLVGSSPVCLVSYDVASKTISRSVLEDFNSNDLGPLNSLWAGDSFYVSDSDTIYAVGPQQARLLLSEEDYDIWPVAANADTLLVQARRSRGSTRLELWAVDLRSGERRWSRVLAGDDPQEYADDIADFVATLAGDTVALVEQHEEPEQMVFELLGLADGASRTRTVIDVEDAGDYIRGSVWGNNHVFLAIDELYSVELSSGRTVSKWP